jgi:hypothetical protein
MIGLKAIVKLPTYQTRSSRIFLVAVIAGLLLSSLVYTAAAEVTPAVRIVLSASFVLTAVNLVLYVVSRAGQLFSSRSGFSLRDPASQRSLSRILFHLSMLVILAGGAVSATTRQGSSTRVVDGFYAPLARFVPGRQPPTCHLIEVSRTEGPVTDEIRYIKGIRTDFTFRDGFLTGVESVLSSNEGGTTRRHVLAYNHPAELDGDKLYLSGEGFAVNLFYRDVEGGGVDQFLMMFDLEGKRKQFTPYAREVGGGRLLVEAIPRAASESVAADADNLLLRLNVKEKGVVLFDGDVPKGAEVLLGTRRLYFGGVYRYVDVMYVRDRGVGVTFAGFIGLILTGSLLMVQRVRTAPARQPAGAEILGCAHGNTA